jgi:hypothetical protein
VEGPAGSDGVNGTNGVNAYTLTTANFIVPPVGTNVTISCLNSSWMTVGQIVVIAGPANFSVVSTPTPTSAILTFKGFTGDIVAGSTIAAGATVSPGGPQGPDKTLLPTISAYAVGGTQALTATPSQALSLQLTLPTTGHYLILATARIDDVGATFASSRTVTLKLRETTNGPADLANAIAKVQTGVITTQTDTLTYLSIPTVDYSAASGDTIQIFVDVSVVPSAGSIEIIEASILAIPLF